ncbi:MAG: putative DNA modification/repair radical SAM protein [Candidatus Altiarchaeota archaeon]|nr:putative DNA modification/repair radical SAM protein [Candidatus Altiarchaeota archaeon]
MTAREKIRALGEGTRYDVCASSSSNRMCGGAEGVGGVLRGGLCHSFTPDGRCVSLFKTLYKNSCSHECSYCSNASSCSRPHKKYSYEPEELARITTSLYRGNYIEGLFLSSGVGGNVDKTMEEMLETARLLRGLHNFRGYMHLKILPGASREHVRQSMELADRVSVNLEAPSGDYLSELAPTKDYASDILLRQRYVKELSRKIPLPAGQTTQLVVGAAGESDKEIFGRVVKEYDDMDLRRAYYSVFTPLEGTRYSEKDAQPHWREHRLYQADWLYRVYKMSPKEIGHAFDEEGFLSDTDPKTVIAQKTLDGPVDPNTAERSDLLKVPGIGPLSAERIIAARRRKKINRERDLAVLGVMIKRARTFLQINGKTHTNLSGWMIKNENT